MMGATKIEWADAVWNPVTGCTPISERIPVGDMMNGPKLSELVYLACPYSHDDEAVRVARFEAANKAAAALMRAGVILFSPISHTHSIGLLALPQDWVFWWRQDCEFLRLCKALVVLGLDGWESSTGVRTEICYARGQHKPVLHMLPEDDPEMFAEILRGI